MSTRASYQPLDTALNWNIVQDMLLVPTKAKEKATENSSEFLSSLATKLR